MILFFFRVTWQEYQLEEASPSELLMLSRQCPNRLPSWSWPWVPYSASHQEKQRQGEKTRNSMRSCKEAFEPLWVPAKWVIPGTEHHNPLEPVMPRGSVLDLAASRHFTHPAWITESQGASVLGWDIPSPQNEVLALRGAPSSDLHVTRYTQISVPSFAGVTLYTFNC